MSMLNFVVKRKIILIDGEIVWVFLIITVVYFNDLINSYEKSFNDSVNTLQ